MPELLLVVVFMILINIHQNGIKNQVSEGFHDLKKLLNAQMFMGESWVSSRLLWRSCSCWVCGRVPRHLYISYFWLDQNLCRIYHCSTECCRLLRVQICEDSVGCPTQVCPAFSATLWPRRGKSKCLDKDHHHHDIIFSLSFISSQE